MALGDIGESLRGEVNYGCARIAFVSLKLRSSSAACPPRRDRDRLAYSCVNADTGSMALARRAGT